jgi:hypothetical protein
MHRYDFPQAAIVQMLVVVAQHVTDADDRAPRVSGYWARISLGNAFAASETIWIARSAVRRRV